MANVTTLYQAEASAAYDKDGVEKALFFLRQYAPFFEVGDGLGRVVTSPLSTTVTAIETAAANLYLIVIKSGASATQDAYLQVFNVASGSVTLGTTAPDEVFKCPAGKTRVLMVLPGDDDNDLYSAAISIAATTTHDGSTALNSASQPTVEIISA